MSEHRRIRSNTRVAMEYQSEHNVYTVDPGSYGFINVAVKVFGADDHSELRYLLSGVNMKGPHSHRFPGRWVDWQERLRATGDTHYLSKSGQLQLRVTDDNTDLLCEILDESIAKYLEQRQSLVKRDVAPEGKFITLIKRCLWCSLDPDALYGVFGGQLLRIAIDGPIDTNSRFEAVMDTIMDFTLTAATAAAALAIADYAYKLNADVIRDQLLSHPDGNADLLQKAEMLVGQPYQLIKATQFSDNDFVEFQIDKAQRKIHLNTQSLFAKRDG